jgi:hypothetical protein
MSHLDEAEAQSRGSSLLYGELLPSAVDKLLDEHHLAGSASSVLCDLGMVRRCCLPEEMLSGCSSGVRCEANDSSAFG